MARVGSHAAWAMATGGMIGGGVYTIAIGAGAAVLAATISLRPLVAITSLGFLGLFCLVNAVAARRVSSHRWEALAGAIGAGGGAIVVIVELVR